MRRPRPVVLAVQGVVLAALVGGTTAFVTLDKTVHVSVDGKTHDVSSFSRTVNDVLRHDGIKVGPHDVVTPALDSPVKDGEQVSVRFGRLLTLTIDGRQRQIWTTASSVDQALGQLGMRADGAYLSVARSRSIGRDGLAVELRTPKRFTVVVDHSRRSLSSTQLTVGAALQQVGVRVGGLDRVNPGAATPLRAGLNVTVQRVSLRTSVQKLGVGFPTVTTGSSSLYKGDRHVTAEGKDGQRQVTWRETLVDGKVAKRDKVKDAVTVQPVAEHVVVGTKSKPVVHHHRSTSSSSSSSSSSGSSSSGSSGSVDVGSSGGLNWGALAKCESGGNPSIVSSNGLYYGLYQFSVETWHAVGGSGLPSQASPSEQTKRAEILYSRSGRGQWPVCGRYL